MPTNARPVVIVPDPWDPEPCEWLRRLAAELPQVHWVEYDGSRPADPWRLAGDVQRAVRQAGDAPLLLARGEGCAVLAHWAMLDLGCAAGALLTEVPMQPRLHMPRFPFPFTTMVTHPLGRPTIERVRAADVAAACAGTLAPCDLLEPVARNASAQASQSLVWLDTLGVLVDPPLDAGPGVAAMCMPSAALH